MLLLTLAALAAEGPLEVEGMPEKYWVNDPRGRKMDPYKFARTVGDEDVYLLHRRSNRLRKTIDITGWVGGGLLVYSGLVVTMLGGFGGSAELALVGVGAMGTGGLTIALVSVNHYMWGKRLDDYDSFYSYEQVVALTQDYNAGLDPRTVSGHGRIDVFPRGNSIAAYVGDDRMTPGEFAKAVGDPTTYRQWNAIRVTCNVVGWTSFGVGAYLALLFGQLAAIDVVDGRMTEEVLIASTGATLAVAGPILVYGTKFLYNDLGRYYTQDQAVDLATGVRAAAPETGPEVDLYPTALVVRW